MVMVLVVVVVVVRFRVTVRTVNEEDIVSSVEGRIRAVYRKAGYVGGDRDPGFHSMHVYKM